MDISRIEYFNAVVDCGSFTRAAKLLHVSQPAITMAIQGLEEELGVKLFLRNGHAPVMTAEGQVFRERSLSLLNSFSSLRSDMRELSADRKHRLNLGIIPVGGANVTTLIHSSFKKLHPEYQLNVLELGSFGCREALEQGDIDLAFMVLLDEYRERYDSIQIHRDVIKVVLHRDNPLAAQEGITVEQLANEPVILLPEHAYVTRQVQARFASANIQPDVIARPTQMFTVFNLIGHNAGISFVLGDGFAFALDSANIVARPLLPEIPYELGFIWKKGARLNPAAKECVRFIKQLSESGEMK